MRKARLIVDELLTVDTAGRPKMDLQNIMDAFLTNDSHLNLQNIMDKLLANDSQFFNDSYFNVSESDLNKINDTDGNYFYFYDYSTLVDEEVEVLDGSFRYYIEVTILWDMII